MAPELEPQITLPWLVKLRWLAVMGQLLALAVARWAFALPLTWWLLLVLVGATAVSNVALTVVARRLPPRWSAASTLGAVLTFDTLLLTLFLAASGGPMNPFTVLYLVHITLSAVVLSAGWTTLVALLSVAGFGSLFLLPMSGHEHHHGMAHHLEGMWAAFVLAATMTAFFVRRIAQAIAHQREQITVLREANARNARLAAITTLAAGAAHELGSPLGTIAVAAHEATLALARTPGAEALSEDLKLILLEVDRCQDVLSRMAARAAETSEDSAALHFDELTQKVRADLGEERSRRVVFRGEGAETSLALPLAQTTQSVAALVRNALDASGADQDVVVEVAARGEDAEISVQDRGSGIPQSILSRVGEPFFTTKQPGRGLGLGVFLVRAFVESMGGALSIESSPGMGTRAVMRIPRRRAIALSTT